MFDNAKASGLPKWGYTLRTLSRSMPVHLRVEAVWKLTVFLGLLVGSSARAQAPMVNVAGECSREIDGFGTTAPAHGAGESWLLDLYYGDLGASILRVDLTPRFRPPVSDFDYNSPWYHNTPGQPGPDGNNVRTYKGLADYSRSWGGRKAPIAVFGPELAQQIGKFDFASPDIRGIGALAQRGQRIGGARGEFKLVGSVWSPAPWLKKSSGAHFEGGGGNMPAQGTPWPFIWAGNFAGGVLDTSDKKLPELADRAGPSSALTQFARITAAYVLGFQRAFGVKFYALSLQNELNFETFYNSCSYPDAKGYASALKALRREFDKNGELRAIKLIGPEDLLGADAYALWQFGDARAPVHKNLQYLATLAKDKAALSALSFIAVHAYSNDGVHAAGDDEQMWRWFIDGWQKAPAAGLPERVQGVRHYGMKSWMTELSGESNVWAPTPGANLSDSALGLALKMHRGLTVGEQSAWLYWQTVDGERARGETLTDSALRARSPKYVAYKHFARYVRPGSCAQPVSVENAPELAVSAYRHPAYGTTVVLINPGSATQITLAKGLLAGAATAHTSTAVMPWQRSTVNANAQGELQVNMPAQSMVTVRAQAGRK
jgi:O-glycosyl hydrolase